MSPAGNAERGGVARWRAASLGTRLAFLSAGITAVMVGAAFLVLRARAEGDVRGVFVSELQASQQALRQLQDRNMRFLLVASSLVSSTSTLRAALETRRGDLNSGVKPQPMVLATIQREVDVIARELSADYLVVTDDSGRVLAGSASEGSPAPGDDLMRIPTVRYALTADAPTADSAFAVLRSATGVPLQVGCVAMLVNGYPAGALLLGERLDRFIPTTGDSAGMRAVVVVGDSVLASTLPAASVGSIWHPQVTGSGDADSRLRIGNEEYVAASLPLGRGEDGRAATMFLVRSLAAAMDPINTALSRSFLLAGMLTVVLVGLGAVAASRATLRPLVEFVSFLRTGADTGTVGHFDAPRSGAEIRTLVDEHNRLMGSLGVQREELERRSRELTTANETLTGEVRERVRAEQALLDSAEQLRQSQKMEALGTMAGGVAHDFNNLLSVIMGYAQLTSQQLPAGSDEHAYITEVTSAANRAAELVRQLLAFSRKQVLQPQIVDLNRVVTDMQALLRPIIPEDIVLRLDLEPGLAHIEADPGQLEQVILNFAVNARDAMPSGGYLVIKTANVDLDERFAGRPEAIAGGPAVMLAVSDTGVGMDETTRLRIFEPFFTTKAPGKGTGLGLATAYGIVRQSGGSIVVYSKPGEGSTFRCHFPRTDGVRANRASAPKLTDTSRGHETILLAEDEVALRTLLNIALSARGYRVLEAADGRQALELATTHQGEIHLVITDVVMPNMGGKELAERVLALRPSTRVLFISGHSDEAIGLRGALVPESSFMQKPIKPDALASKVREVLDAELSVQSER